MECGGSPLSSRLEAIRRASRYLEAAKTAALQARSRPIGIVDEIWHVLLPSSPRGASEAEIIRTEVDQMVYAEELGYDSVWLTEHHFADYGLSASPSVLASAVLSRTTGCR